MYEDYYHFQAKPFRLSPDPEFFFASRGHKRALAYLRYGLSQDEGFVVITGSPGTGKTTLAQILLQEMEQSQLVVAHLTTTQLEADELLRMVAASFGLRYDGVDKAGLLKTMEAFLMARAREHKRALLVVDEAQNLPLQSLEELRMLSNLQVGGKALLQTFLLGQVQFRQKLDHPDLEQLRQRVIANYHLSELGEDECQSYIETRLQHVGWQNDPKITAAAYDGIYQYTQGIPRRINMLCDRLMLFSCIEERHEIDNSVLRDVTDELQQEISGKPIKKGDLVKDKVKSENVEFDPLTAQIIEKSPEPAHDEEGSLEEYFGTEFSDNESAVEEFEAKDQHSAYSDVKDEVLDRVMPDEGYDTETAQMQEENPSNKDNASQSSEQSKDRFRVIAGGRGAGQVSKSANADAPKASRASKRTTGNSSTRSAQPVPGKPTDSDEVILRKILRLVLAYHRSPRSFPGLDDSTQVLPNGIKQILSLAISDDQTLKNFRQISVMGISPSMLRAAVRFFVRRVMFLPGGDDFRVLGLPSDATQAQVEEHYDLLMRLMRQEKKGADETGVTRIGESYERLCQSEITHVPDESRGDKKGNDIDDFMEDELDLDLAPNIGDATAQRKSATSKVAVTQNIITSDERTAPTGRNIMLIVGTVVVIFVLYFTQITVTEKPDVAGEMMDADKQHVAELSQQGSDAPPEKIEELGLGNSGQASDQTQLSTQSEQTAKQENTEDEKVLRQRILTELRAEADVIEKSRREAEAAERARMEAVVIKAAQAQAVAEAKARQEAQARAKAETATKLAMQQKAAAEARASVALKEKQAALKVKQEKARALAKAKADARVAAKKKAATVIKAPVNSKNARARELKSFVSRLETVYAAGDLQEFSSFFAAAARTNDQTNLKGIREDYKTLFNGTSSRQLKLSNLDWELDNNFARGVGEYEVVTRSSGASQDSVSKGKVTIQMEGEAGHLQITRFYFSETQSSKKGAKSSGARASTKELNQVLENFAGAYKAGNIKQFMTLFSPNASTNDRSTLQGIRGDYVELFAGTEVRRLDYNSMQWKWEGNVANGIGTYVVTVQPNGKDKTDIYRGKLRFSIQQYGDKLLISKFVFE